MPAFALNWDGKQWIQRGCPSNLQGTWISENKNIPELKTLTIQENKIRITTSSNLAKNYIYSGDIFPRENRFVEIGLHSIDKKDKQDIYYKVWPHLVSLRKDLKVLI